MSPPIDVTLEILGRETTLQRLDRAIAAFSATGMEHRCPGKDSPCATSRPSVLRFPRDRMRDINQVDDQEMRLALKWKPVRALTVLGAAVFTPQAAATVGYISQPAQRGKNITFVHFKCSCFFVIALYNFQDKILDSVISVSFNFFFYNIRNEEAN